MKSTAVSKKTDWKLVSANRTAPRDKGKPRSGTRSSCERTHPSQADYMCEKWLASQALCLIVRLAPHFSH